jgi:hypothetical protein
MSGSVENATTSAGCPEATALLWEPEGPKDEEKEIPLPAEVFEKAEVSAS